MKRIVLFLWILCTLASVSACSDSSINNPEGEIPVEEVSYYKDGIYKVTYSHTFPNGWRPEMEMSVISGIITSVRYNEFDAQQKSKLTNEEYRTAIQSEHQVELQNLYTRLYNSFLKNQSPDSLPIIYELPALRENFRTLAEHLASAARFGRTEPLILSTNATYRTDFTQENPSYRLSLAVTFTNDNITRVRIDLLEQEDPAQTEEPPDNELPYEDLLQTAEGIIIENNALQTIDVPLEENPESDHIRLAINEMLKK
ncbi:MAG TPA: hypothetical protein DHN33_02710, partial [Eubacteriaceae bacterium]|nr:hypothetical protein [Eubacteriaceae bacterium]